MEDHQSTVKNFIELKYYSRTCPLQLSEFAATDLIIENKPPGRVYALKSINYNLVKPNEQKKFVKLFYRLQNLTFPSLLPYNLISFVDINQSPHPTFAFDHCKNGNLVDCYQFFSRTDIIINIFGIVEGMKYLHEKKVAHQALEIWNIFVDADFRPKIACYGLSEIINLFQLNNVNRTFFSLSKMQRFASEDDTPFTDDVFAFSFILYFLLTGVIPFDCVSPSALFQRISLGMRPPLTSNIPTEFLFIINNCWNNDPKKRPTFANISKAMRNMTFDDLDKQKIKNYMKMLKMKEEEEETTNNNAAVKYCIHDSKNTKSNIMPEKVPVEGIPKPLKPKISSLHENAPEKVFEKVPEKTFKKVQENATSEKANTGNISEKLFKKTSGKVPEKVMEEMKKESTKEMPKKLGKVLSAENASHEPYQTINKTEGAAAPEIELTKVPPSDPAGNRPRKQTARRTPTFSKQAIQIAIMKGKAIESSSTIPVIINSPSDKIDNPNIHKIGIMRINSNDNNLNNKSRDTFFHNNNNNSIDSKNISSSNNNSNNIKSNDNNNCSSKNNLLTEISKSRQHPLTVDDLKQMLKKGKLLITEGQVSEGLKLLEDVSKNPLCNISNSNDKSLSDINKINKSVFFYLGHLHERGLGGLPKDLTAAARFYRKSVELGSLNAKVAYGRLACKGAGGVKHDIAAGVALFLAAAEEGHIEGMYQYGKHNNIDPRNRSRAIRFLKSAAEKGHVKASNLYGEYLGEKLEFEKAAKFFKFAADRGESNAQNNYGSYLQEGTGVETDFDLAAKYFKMSADQNNAWGLNSYGVALSSGIGVEQDLVMARKYVKRAADMNNESAQNNYADMLLQGIGGEVNEKEAAKYFKMSADAGCTAALFQYANMLVQGDVVQQDLKMARSYLKRLIEIGNDDYLVQNAKVFLKDLQKKKKK